MPERKINATWWASLTKESASPPPLRAREADHFRQSQRLQQEMKRADLTGRGSASTDCDSLTPLQRSPLLPSLHSIRPFQPSPMAFISIREPAFARASLSQNHPDRSDSIPFLHALRAFPKLQVSVPMTDPADPSGSSPLSPSPIRLCVGSPSKGLRPFP